MQGEKDGGKEDSREERSEKGKSGEKIHPPFMRRRFYDGDNLQFHAPNGESLGICDTKWSENRTGFVSLY